jgi:hypothetical protein
LSDDITKTIAAAQKAMKQFDSLSKLPASTVAQLESARRLALPMAKAIEALNSNKQLQAAFASLRRQQDQLKIVSLGAGLDKQIVNQLSGFTQQAEAVQRAAGAFNARFELPDTGRIRALLDGFKISNWGIRCNADTDSSARRTAIR